MKAENWAWIAVIAFVTPFIIACWLGLAWLVVEFWRAL